MKAPNRKIIHVDMDAFFAAVEQRDFPELRGKPVAVGGDMKRGVVAAASYEARKYGVHSAMPTALAYKKCPQIIFVHGRYDAYKEASKLIMNIFREYTDLVEPMSLDEAYLDVTENKMENPSATRIAREIKDKIKKETLLTASAGVSFCKFLAKVASDYDKPDGLYVITPDDADAFVAQLPIGKIPGIGPATEAKMKELAISTGADLKRMTRYALTNAFGKMGAYFYDLLRFDIDDPVTPEHTAKSVGAEETFERDINEEQQMLFALHEIASRVGRRLQKADLFGKTVTLKIKYQDFVQHTRARTLRHLIQSEGEIFDVAAELLFVPVKPIKPVRLLGISISNLNNEPKKQIAHQLAFDFYAQEEIEKTDEFPITVEF